MAISGDRLKSIFSIDWKFVPLKLQIFLWGSAAFSILPYLTIHMKDIGLSIDHIALIYAVLPFTIFIAPPAIGFLADKLGSFTRVLFLTLLGTGIFHSMLLFVPTNLKLGNPPNNTSLYLVNDTATFSWTPCNLEKKINHTANEQKHCSSGNKKGGLKDYINILGDDYLTVSFDLSLQSCKFSCPSDAIQLCESFSNMMICSENKKEDTSVLQGISLRLLVRK